MTIGDGLAVVAVVALLMCVMGVKLKITYKGKS